MDKLIAAAARVLAANGFLWGREFDRASGGLQDRALRRSAALNTHRSAATKFTATITPTASALAGIGGNPNPPVNRAIKAALPAMEETPLAS